ncbi:uncharacterized protein MONBRDRAFT_32354 [Monosiga brevicollis MX1]|uniref:Renin receptor-like C-terminal transmembrane spanning segment domain-containing protein n=1 Tax=Monosiga brevicollis TaxID=81824 RepID=A9UZ02_MONBE|nr:uncharacterized protein MONBRDRAFT_32354 [Monosiga brevicollis MX1]EDQ89699.1 predicted protein [Monosiga brevicollis MX1]|eukprot:XP_001745728.1 hypothetical protein [Monosiga brevicollis MX1]
MASSLPTMAMAALLLAAACTLSAIMPPSTVSFDHVPSTLQTLPSGAAMSSSDLANVLLAAVGVNTQPAWQGLAPTHPFKRTQSAVLFVIDGAYTDLPQLAGNNAVEVMTATESADFLAADMTDDILPLAAEHAQCEIYSFTQPAVQVDASLWGTTLDMDLSNKIVQELALELTGLLASYQPSADAKSMAVLRVTQLANVIRATGADSAEAQIAVQLVALFKQVVLQRAKDAANGDALVMTTIVQAPAFAASSSIRARRDVAADPIPSNVNLKINTLDSQFVEYCETYTCYCNRDIDGKPYDVDTRCSVSCSDKQKDCFDCAYIPCDCNATDRLQPGAAVCAACQDGFDMIGNHCYESGDFSVATNIILGLGILIFISLLATCCSLAYMNPGYDSIIYKMTSTHLKSS